ncbi:SIMPL domain-containing protein [Streptomyces sp. VNUA24]|uniref:SIMPL domain-containing protein n=1 Tax=Streptomyces sp. VNUA24 TaxID=3031131 RepID=UPI0023B85D8F|nr:SIMPL domain-containing protein [Streptomyces sp. VNUA24]WEH12446.1 SIMPL domain-containing protein [Streptomyces sp. VNUA24]
MTGQPSRPYGTPTAPRVAVRGEAPLEVDPDLARIGITVTARGNDRGGTLGDLARRNTAALDLVRSYGDVVERLETGTPAITPQLTERGRRERVRAYHGHIRTTAELTDFTALGELTTRLAELDLTGVDGPWWALRPDSPVHRTARLTAVHDAVRRARDYAESLDSTLVALLELSDSSLDAPVSAEHDPYGAVGTEGCDGAEPPDALHLQPERQIVFAQVEAHFVMTPPRLGPQPRIVGRR